MENKKVELLLPAGNLEKMKYALAFGADAVYLGIPRYSLRARENGFVKESIAEAIEYAHSLGKKVYVTANVIPHNHKVHSFTDYVRKFLETSKPDAWIMSDPGLIMLMREQFPEQVIHLSVQANTVNYASAKFWQQIGVKRIILSRELSIPEIREIKQGCPDMEIEVFVHGAICIAYSGRCLISNYMSYRDPNQGTCSHSCRWEYKVYKKEENQADTYQSIQGEYFLEETERPGEMMAFDEDENGTYLMNARDLCAIEYLKELQDAGVDSFKVEGRSKSAYYAGMIARAYRRAIDDLVAGREFNPENLNDVFSTSNRGFIAGFLKGNPGRSAQKYDSATAEMPAYRYAGIVRGYDEERGRIRVQPKNVIRLGDSLELITPEGNEMLEVSELWDEDRREISEIHAGPQRSAWIPCKINPGSYALLRQKIENEENGEDPLSKTSHLAQS